MRKKIRLTAHAGGYKTKRGFTEDEVVDAIKSEKWDPVELGRFECRKNFEFKQKWNEVFYRVKQVRPIFVEEQNEIVVITVYTYYF